MGSKMCRYDINLNFLIVMNLLWTCRKKHNKLFKKDGVLYQLPLNRFRKSKISSNWQLFYKVELVSYKNVDL